MALCMTCHDKPVGISREEVMKAFTEEIEGKEFLHGPVAQKDCKGCHTSHGSEQFRLLSKVYPSEFYAPFKKENYELCFSCHEDTLVLTKETDDLTDFRNGNSNLHYLHVNKAQRGRTCRSCHETHGSNLPKHIRATVPYGMWELPIKFQKTETGGSCKPGCHLPFAYDRNTPVEYVKQGTKPVKVTKPKLKAKSMEEQGEELEDKSEDKSQKEPNQPVVSEQTSAAAVK
jgi:predicted CXXCH cytochrome family protein